ncbi:MAG: 1-acyl-sn-glycerol-3-phosphate acyltransferase [Pseudomonadales bacterium]|nr:1-acyl-sn-glycerol-3-phosphate acyltransferase [Pseudomonadales bacterium]
MKSLLINLYKYLFFFPFFAIMTATLAYVCVFVCLFSQRIASRYIARFWARATYRLSFSRLRIVGQEHLDPKRSYVVVVNHMSVFDILVLYGYLDLDLRWVMKKELRKMPFLGWATAALGHIFMDRSNSQKAFETLRALKQTLPESCSILFFPEGTRSNGELKRFKRGAFNTAKTLEFAVLPITLNGTEKIMPSNTLELHPGLTEIIIHPAISEQQVQDTDELVLAAECQQIIGAARIP